MKLQEYERELEEARRRHAEITAKLKSMAQEEQEIVAVVRGWEAIVAQKRKQAGDQDAGPAAFEPLPDVSDSRQVGEDEEDSGENKTQFVRDQILAHAATGMKPADLKKAADNVGMEYPQSWPYGPLQRLKKKGEIVKRRGRFYPVATTTID